MIFDAHQIFYSKMNYKLINEISRKYFKEKYLNEHNEFNENDLEFESISELYQQIEICWCCFELDELLNHMRSIFTILKTKSIQLSSKFFDHQFDVIIISLLDGQYYMLLRSVSLSIFQVLCQKNILINYFEENQNDKRVKRFTKNFVIQSFPIITKLEAEYINQILVCYICLYEQQLILFDTVCSYINIGFLLDMLDKTNVNDSAKFKIEKLLTMFNLSNNISSLFFGDNIESQPRKFSVLLWYFINDPDLFDQQLDFDVSHLILICYNVLHTFYNISNPKISNVNQIKAIILPCLLFCSLFFIKKNRSSIKDDYKQLISIIMFYTTYPDAQISASSFYCISCYTLLGEKQAVDCLESNLLETLNNHISILSQNQIKREATRCLCHFFLHINNYNIIIKNMNDNIFDLLMNVIEYNLTDITLLILKVINLIIQRGCLSDSYFQEKFRDFRPILENTYQMSNQEPDLYDVNRICGLILDELQRQI